MGARERQCEHRGIDRHEHRRVDYYGVATGNGFLHPANPGTIAVGFRAPATATYDISGNLGFNQSSGSDGALWFLDRGSTNLTSGSLTFGDSTPFSYSNLSLTAGEMVFFVLDAGGSSGNRMPLNST